MSGVTPDLPIWAQWFAALAVPIAALVGILLGALNYVLSQKKRKDELFDKRYDHFKLLWRLYIEKNGSDFIADGEHIYRDGFNWDYHAIQAGFLFGEDVEKHVRSFNRGPKVDLPVEKERWQHVAPSAWFTRPFKPYLELRR